MHCDNLHRKDLPEAAAFLDKFVLEARRAGTVGGGQEIGMGMITSCLIVTVLRTSTKIDVSGGGAHSKVRCGGQAGCGNLTLLSPDPA